MVKAPRGYRKAVDSDLKRQTTVSNSSKLVARVQEMYGFVYGNNTRQALHSSPTGLVNLARPCCDLESCSSRVHQPLLHNTFVQN